jgi:hypothetical protein
MLIILVALIGLFMKKLLITINAFIFIIFSGINLPAEENYCLDKDSRYQWENLIKRYPGDPNIQTLHALRPEPCVIVEHGDLSVQQASNIVYQTKDAVIIK